MNIFLLGYMGSGKSTIGRKLSQRLRWSLVDTDKEIEQSEGMSVAKIFAERGEEYFRTCERNMVEESSQYSHPTIISTGGGLPIWGDNMMRMNELGLTIYLARSAENIASRLSPAGRERRPKLRGLDDMQLVAFMREGIVERDPIYRTARLVIEAERYNDDEILDIIVAHING